MSQRRPSVVITRVTIVSLNCLLEYCNHILLINFTCYFSEEKILQKGAISNKTFPGELDDELDKAIKNVSKEAEEKKILLKVAISDKTPQEHCNFFGEKILLGELIDELNREVKSFSNDTKENEIFLTELPMNGCRGVFFCQAEHELKKEVSGLSDAKFDNFRIDKKLMRNLNMYNKHHVKTCKPADEDQEILLLDSLEKLLTCAKIAYHQPK
ncbi:uncharacterized protein LOC122146204 [Cyprinus carpio]|uniref:Uncharacterized protein LOC122146204 n=1 Tax=Cyprinus carpio TaxID=7962 RepID=A0A9Q9YHN3_CYPCA|nr:uncharacterized protein LOC122146204 [Cyprinus carpio]